MDHEKQAIDDCLHLQNTVGSISVVPSGLTLYASHPFLGASGDGIVMDDEMPEEQNKGILEVKCPYSIKGQKINEMEIHEIVAMGCREFCLENSPDGGPQLKRSHMYYAQVQGEMAIKELPWCDFVVWTGAESSNCFIERIDFDKEFVTGMLIKLLEFYALKVVPEICKL